MHKNDSDSLFIGQTRKLQSTIAICTILCCSFAIFLSIFPLVFNIKYRKSKWVKMSSPRINNLINLSCVFLYLAPILNAIKGLYLTNTLIANITCQMNACIVPVFTTIIYASILAKAWRVFQIFDTVSKFKRIVIKDHHLLGYISIVVTVDVVILIVWQSVDNIKLTLRFIHDTEKFQASNAYVDNGSGNIITSMSLKNSSRAQILKNIYECNSHYFEIWSAILTIHKIIQLMYGIYVAWIIRNVNVPSMNDSKYLLFSSFAILTFGLGSMALISLLKDWPDIVHVVFTIGILAATLTTQHLLFIPKLLIWHKKRNDNCTRLPISEFFMRQSKANKTHKKTKNSLLDQSVDFEDELCNLLHENSQLKSFLKKKEELIKLLEQKIRQTKDTLYKYDHVQSAVTGRVTHKCESDCTISGENISSVRSSDSSTETGNINNSEFERFGPTEKLSENVNANDDDRVLTTDKNVHYLGLFDNNLAHTEQIKSHLNEVERLTCRVRDSISLDLSNARSFSPFLHDYYSKKLELVKSIQSTYNVQCDTSTVNTNSLMGKYFRNQTVHNPEYVDIDLLDEAKANCAITTKSFESRIHTDALRRHNCSNTMPDQNIQISQDFMGFKTYTNPLAASTAFIVSNPDKSFHAESTVNDSQTYV